MNRLVYVIITSFILALSCQGSAIAQESIFGLSKDSSTEKSMTHILSLLLAKHEGKEGLIINDDPNSKEIISGFANGVLFGYTGEKNSDGTAKKITGKYEVDPNGQWQIYYTYDDYFRVVNIDGNDIKITLEYISDTQVKITSIYKNEAPVIEITDYSQRKHIINNKRSTVGTKTSDCPVSIYSYNNFNLVVKSICDRGGSAIGTINDPFTNILKHIGSGEVYKKGNDTEYVFNFTIKAKDIDLSYNDFQCDCYRKAEAIQDFVGLGTSIITLPTTLLGVMTGPIGMIIRKQIISMFEDAIEGAITDVVIKSAVCNETTYNGMVNTMNKGNGAVVVERADKSSDNKTFSFNPFDEKHAPLRMTITKPAPCCGNGVQEGGEECDDNLGGCSSICELLCGNNVVDAGEACDDGNNIDGDGCSSTCEVSSLVGTWQMNYSYYLDLSVVHTHTFQLYSDGQASCDGISGQWSATGNSFLIIWDNHTRWEGTITNNTISGQFFTSVPYKNGTWYTI